jgi:outer membrane protein assembly factor BamB
MKDILIFLFVLIFFYGCTPSSIKLNTAKGLSSHSMFGKTAGRVFYTPVTVGDEIILKWEAEINGSFPNSSITSYDNYIFVNDLSGRVYCFDASNGKVVGALKHSGAVYTSPVIDDSKLIFAVAVDDESKSWLYYYNFYSAKELNEIEIPGRVMTEMIKTDEEIYFCTENGKVFCYNLQGEKTWDHNTKTKTHSSPALGNSIVIFGNDEGEIIGLNAEDGKVKYRKKIGESFFCGAAIDGNTAYIGNDNGNLYALDLSSGNKKWKFNTGSRITMTPVFNETHIIIGNLKGEIYSVDKISGKLNWRTNTKGVLNASPLLTKNFIILPDLNEAYHFIDVKTGEIKSTYQLEGRGKLTPVIFNEVLYIGYDNGIVRAYEFKN